MTADLDVLRFLRLRTGTGCVSSAAAYWSLQRAASPACGGEMRCVEFGKIEGGAVVDVARL